MNKEIKKYIKYVKKIIPFYSKDKKEFLKLLTQKIIEFSNTQPNCTYQNIIDEFGSPNEVAGSYIESLENDDIIKQLNKKYIFKTLVTIIIFISIGIWCLEIYHFNKLYQDARDSIHGYWVEEITEDSRIENGIMAPFGALFFYSTFFNASSIGIFLFFSFDHHDKQIRNNCHNKHLDINTTFYIERKPSCIFFKNNFESIR